MRILVVDDDTVNRQVLSAMLGIGGVDVVETDNAASALRFISEQDFSAVLMDLRMPSMDGLEATQLIRKKDGQAWDVPLAIVTADTSPDLAELCAAAGADELIRKPIRMDQLYDALGRLFIKPRGGARSTGQAA